ncbi:hypothetical protein Q361_1237 [Flavobacterium croceum DSM 17960]|uniref:Uncharacterized protein n=1 Tax=Flavobacterium croceum DSM 17960 TaxID=1121886 RepID=A0A2S4N4V4_9FLAO|nr:hypothetical protein Q361_1237 [Flavobacterium croceum DSM 17960]
MNPIYVYGLIFYGIYMILSFFLFRKLKYNILRKSILFFIILFIINLASLFINSLITYDDKYYGLVIAYSIMIMDSFIISTFLSFLIYLFFKKYLLK